MQLIFKVSGEFKNGRYVTEVTEEHVESKAIFNVHDSNAIVYVDKGYAERYKEPEPITLEEIKKMTVAELKDYATKNSIDLGEATKKDDVLEVIEKTFEVK